MCDYCSKRNRGTLHVTSEAVLAHDVSGPRFKPEAIIDPPVSHMQVSVRSRHA